MSTLTIRQARPDDCPLILQFIRDLALYERALDEVQATVPQLEALLFGENPRVYGVICEEDGEALGFALYFFNFSSWLGRLGLYLEDLYVNPAQRGTSRGCRRLWSFRMERARLERARHPLLRIIRRTAPERMDRLPLDRRSTAGFRGGQALNWRPPR